MAHFLRRALTAAVSVLALSSAARAQIAPTTQTPPEGAQTPPATAPPRLLQFVQAEYPPDALAANFEGSVRLQLSVDATGHVTDVTLVEGIGHGLDEAAVAAARQFQFEPARREGVPTASVVPYRYRFSLAAARAAQAPRYRAVVRGVVRSGSDRAVEGATVNATLPGNITRTQVTDVTGGFRFECEQTGEVSLEISAPTFRTLRATETVADRDDLQLTYRLSAEALQATPTGPAAPARPGDPDENDVAGEAVVRARRPPREVTRQTLEFQEIRRMPGTGGDALRAVQNFPGVARSINGLLLVRGTTPQDTQIFADGTNLPLVYHFFGLSSVVSTELLERIDFYPGNFSSRFGRAQGGIVDIGLRNPRREGYHAVVNINLIDASAFVEGRINRQLSFAAAFRRSYVDAVLGAVLSGIPNVSLTTLPVYYDYQFLLDYHPSTRDHLRFAFLGSDDQFAILFSRPNDAAPRFTGAFSSGTGFNTGQLLWEHTFSSRVSSRAVFSVGRNALNIGGAEQFGLNLAFWQITGRYELSAQLHRTSRLNVGVDLSGGPAVVSYNGIRPPTEGQMVNQQNAVRVSSQSTEVVYTPAAYAEMELTPTPSLRLIPGLRVDYTRAANRTATVSPRFSFRWEFSHDWFLKGGAGLFTQAPQPFQTSTAPNAVIAGTTLGNPLLLPQRAVGYSLGMERNFSQYVSLSLEGFFKTLDNQVVSQTTFTGTPYTNAGGGDIYGMEILLRHRPSRRFFGWVAYTLSRSQRRDSLDAPTRVFQFDQTHILTVIGSYRLGRGWEAGLRFRYVTGNPTTPVVGGLLNGDQGTYNQIPGQLYSTRVGAFHQLDVRIDKTWTFSRWNLNLFLEVLNVYNHTNPEGVQYNYNFTQSQTIGGIPFFPNLGIRGEF